MATDTGSPWWDIFLAPVNDLTGGGLNNGIDLLQGGIGNWLTGLGGDLASGMETGLVAILGDLWNVIAGPVLVFIGVVIAIVTLGWAFRHQLISAASVAALAAA